ncbi:YbaY family lipoprotein [Seohaeicola saemankumensis]|nr:YbaY family lipoprotein [Seohaeicola saemankumensis]MCA0873211.1 YbaY family lipoprotein [Seohaeicola saemankumensis]
MTKKMMAAVAALAISAITAMTGLAQAGTVSGTVTYLERIAVPPGAVLEVELHDVSRADAASVRLSGQRFALDRVPFPFALSYDDNLIDERMSYTVQARILSGDVVLYRSTTAYPVLTRGAAGEVDIVVDRMAAPQAASADVPVGTWQVGELGGRMLVAEKRPDLEFRDDGSFGGSTSCNRYRGTAEFTGDGGLSFPDNIAATLMACPPPYDKLERDFLKALGEVEGYVLNGDNLALVNGAGVAVIRLMRMH